MDLKLCFWENWRGPPLPPICKGAGGHVRNGWENLRHPVCSLGWTWQWLRVSKPPACPTTMTHFNSSLQLSFEIKVKGRTWCFNIRRYGASSWYSDDQIRLHWALSVQYWSMEKVTDCESTDDSQQLISDFNMEELKEKWTREQLELSKRVSEVLRKKTITIFPWNLYRLMSVLTLYQALVVLEA